MATLVNRNQQSFVEFQNNNNNAKLEIVEYTKNDGTVKHFLRMGVKTFFTTEATMKFILENLDTPEKQQHAREQLQYIESRKPDAEDIDANYVPCICRKGGKVVGSL